MSDDPNTKGDCGCKKAKAMQATPILPALLGESIAPGAAQEPLGELLPPDRVMSPIGAPGGGGDVAVHPSPPPQLTVLHTVYYQQNDREPVAVETNYVRDLLTREQVYVREMRVGSDWMPLDLAWLRQCSYLVITNELPRWMRQPTEEETAVAAAKVVEIAFVSPVLTEQEMKRRDMFSPCQPDRTPVASLLVHPATAQPLVPVNAEGIMLRCRAGVTNVTVRMFPL